MDWPQALAVTDHTLIAAFGVGTTYQPAVGSAVSVRGIFDAAYVDVTVGEAGVSSNGPAVFYRVEDLPHVPAIDEHVIVAGVDYVVIQVKPDGQGGVVCRLHRS